MSVKANKETLVRYFDGINRGNAAITEEVFAPQFTLHGTRGDYNREQYQNTLENLLKAFPDLKFTLEEMVCEGDKMAVRYSATGTHRGPYMGIQATGRRVNNSGMSFYHFMSGKIAEIWLIQDNLVMLQQLGAVPTAAAV